MWIRHERVSLSSCSSSHRLERGEYCEIFWTGGNREIKNFNDTMLKAIAANQLDKWRVTQKKSEKNVETLAIELYSSIVQAHNVFATRNVGSTKRARISQQIHTRGRMYLQKWPNMMMQANALKD